MITYSMKLPDTWYVGMRKSSSPSGMPFAYMTPDGTDKPAEKRRNGIANWAKAGSGGFDPVFMNNEPVMGFRIATSTRNYGWGGGNYVIRIEDPRGFEAEITVANFVMIADNNAILNGEIQQKCVWARDGNENYLLPVNSEPYKQAKENTERMALKVSTRGLKPGNKVELADGTVCRYVGLVWAVERDRETTYAQSNGYNRWGSPRTRKETYSLSKRKQHVLIFDEKKDAAGNILSGRMVEARKVAPKVSRLLDETEITIQEALTEANEMMGTNRRYNDNTIGYVSSADVKISKVFEAQSLEDLIAYAETPGVYAAGYTLIAKRNSDNNTFITEASQVKSILNYEAAIASGRSINQDYLLMSGYGIDYATYAGSLDTSVVYDHQRFAGLRECSYERVMIKLEDQGITFLQNS